MKPGLPIRDAQEKQTTRNEKRTACSSWRRVKLQLEIQAFPLKEKVTLAAVLFQAALQQCWKDHFGREGKGESASDKWEQKIAKERETKGEEAGRQWEGTGEERGSRAREWGSKHKKRRRVQRRWWRAGEGGEGGPAPLGLTNRGPQFCGSPACLPQELCHPGEDRLSTG